MRDYVIIQDEQLSLFYLTNILCHFLWTRLSHYRSSLNTTRGETAAGCDKICLSDKIMTSTSVRTELLTKVQHINIFSHFMFRILLKLQELLSAELISCINGGAEIILRNNKVLLLLLLLLLLLFHNTYQPFCRMLVN